MNKTVFLTLLLALSLLGCQDKPLELNQESSPEEIDYEKEKAAILELIRKESEAFWNKDFEQFASCWVQEDYIRTMGWWEAGGVTVIQGWQERGSRTKRHMEQSPAPNPTATRVKRENINIRIFKDVAWLTFDQYGEDTGDAAMDMPGLSRETRILEKKDGQWKIAYVGWLLEGEKKDGAS